MTKSLLKYANNYRTTAVLNPLNQNNINAANFLPCTYKKLYLTPNQIKHTLFGVLPIINLNFYYFYTIKIKQLINEKFFN